MAYCYALLSACSYTRRFAEELRTPGPRVPLTRNAELFRRTVTAGEDLLRLHTYGEVIAGNASWIGPIPGEYPSTYGYDRSRQVLTIGNGVVGPVSSETWGFGLSGYGVLNGWLRRRIKRRGKSPLDAIGPDAWPAALTRELLELLWLIEITLARQPELDELLAGVVSSDCVQGVAVSSST
jgi:hypothetical protein